MGTKQYHFDENDISSDTLALKTFVIKVIAKQSDFNKKPLLKATSRI